MSRRRTVGPLAVTLLLAGLGLVGSSIPAAATPPSTPHPPVGAWGPSRLVDPQAGLLQQVSCPGRNACWLVDASGNVVGEHGHRFDAPLRVVTPGPNSISCSGQTCVVVGARDSAARLVDGAWEHLETPSQSAFHLVSCASASFCLALGQHGGRTLQGSAWGPRRTFDPDAELTDISCATLVMCIAGDSAGHLFRFDGAEWTPVPDVHLLDVQAISCPQTDFCVALGTNQRMAVYDGSHWASRATPPSYFSDVACVSATFCVLAGGYDVSFFDGTTWTAPEHVVDGTGIYDVACSAPDACQALVYGDQVLRYDGTDWTPVTAEHTQGGYIRVSCPTKRFCGMGDAGGNWLSYRDGTWSGVQNVDSTTIEDLDCETATFCAMGDYNGGVLTYDGETWTTPQQVGLDFVNGLDCVVPSFCFAVGNGTVSRWDGSTWSPAESIDPGYFFTAVSCFSVSYCVAVDEGQNRTRSMVWDGASWSAPAQVAAGQIDVFNLQCVTPAFCVAATTGSTYATFDGSAWSDWKTIPGFLSDTRLSCTTPTFCVATGDQSRSVWDGDTWSRAVLIDPTHPPHGGGFQGVGLTTVSCASESFCVAADARGRVLMTDHP